MILNIFLALHELQVDMSVLALACTLYYKPFHRPSPDSSLYALSTSHFQLRLLICPHPRRAVWARMSHLTLYPYEETGAMRLFHLAPNFSLRICSLHSHEYHLEPLTHTNLQYSFVTAGLAYRHCICAHQRLQDPMATFLIALTLPDLRALNFGTRSWTGEESKGVESGTVGTAIDIGLLGLLDCYDQGHW